jgi:hypothetical protein
MRSVADVPTPAAARYAKQLASHLAHRVPVTEQADGSWIVAVGAAQGRITATVSSVNLQAEAPDEAALEQMEHVLGDHLQRFGRRAELAVTWRRLPA